MNLHMIPLPMLYATLLKRLGVKHVTVFYLSPNDLAS
jgi:hypothetical protein